MLVLTRKVVKPSNPEETVVLRNKTTGEIIAVIGVVKASNSRIKLGIDAKDDIEILRGETLGTEEGFIHVKPTNQGLLKIKDGGHGTTKKSA